MKDNCFKCGFEMEAVGSLPYSDFPISVDSTQIYACYNQKCERYGLLTTVSKP